MERGSILICKWIYSVGKSHIDLSNDEYKSIQILFQYGHLDLIKYFYPLLTGLNTKNCNAFFEIAAENGHIEIVKWYYTIFNGIDICHIFTLACRYNHPEVAEWICEVDENESNEINNIDMSETFMDSIYNENTKISNWIQEKYNFSIDFEDVEMACSYIASSETLKWFYETFKYKYDIFDIVLKRACYLENLDFVKYLRKNNSRYTDNSDYCYPIGKNLDDIIWVYETVGEDSFKNYLGEYFEKACKNGNFDVAVWIYDISIGVLTLERYISDATCSGNLNLVSWLCETHCKNYGLILAGVITESFNDACAYGYIDIAKYIFDKYLQVEDLDFDLPEHLVRKNRLNVLQWLYDDNILKEIIHNNSKKLFSLACMHGIPDIAKWIYKISNGSCMGNDIDFLLIRVCGDCNLEFAKWLFDVSNKKIKNNRIKCQAFMEACKAQNYEVARWIYEKYRGQINITQADENAIYFNFYIKLNM